MNERAERLAAFLDAVALRPLVWGVDDCLTGFLAEWVRLERGVDPAAPWRGRLRGQIGCALAVNRAGGLVPFVERALCAVGVEQVDLAKQAPVLGDIGVVKALTEEGVQNLGAICVGAQWAVRSAGGMFFCPATPLAAWRV